jgi:hypothetical protein
MFITRANAHRMGAVIEFLLSYIASSLFTRFVYLEQANHQKLSYLFDGFSENSDLHFLFRVSEILALSLHGITSRMPNVSFIVIAVRASDPTL